MAKGEWDTLLGIRRDVDLTERWWHRLFKVVYILLLAIALAISSLLIWEQRDKLQPKRNHVTVTRTLGEELFDDANKGASNVIPLFMARDGRTGYVRDSKEIEAVSDYNMERSLCTASPLEHVEEVAALLNSRAYSTAYNADGVRKGILEKRDPKDALHLCWMDSSLLNRDINNFVKYEFTFTGYCSALFDYMVPFILWIGGVHVVLLNMYYRGLVYIIVGPKKKAVAKPIKEDDDDDWKEIDEDIDKLTKDSAQ